MNKIFKFTLAPIIICVIALGLSSCKKDNELISDPTLKLTANDVILQSVSAENGCLVFDSIQHMEKVINAILRSDKESVNQFYKKYQFTSLQTIFDNVNDELSKVTSIEQAKDVKAKYLSTFLFNTDDETDVPPYLPIKNALYAMVLNASGEAIIRNEKMNFREYTSYNQTPMYNSQFKTKNVEGGKNWVHVYDGKRKMWANAEASDQSVWILFGAQVKSFWGWNVYKESYGLYVNPTSYDSKWSWCPYTRGVWYHTGVVRGDNWIEFGRQWRTVLPEIPSTKVPGVMYYDVKETLLVHSSDMGVGNIGTLEIEFASY